MSDVVMEARAHLSLWGDKTMRGEDIALMRSLIAEVEQLRAALRDVVSLSRPRTDA